VNLTVIIPALNEEAALALVLHDLRRVLATLSYIREADIIVADNGSTDRTAAIANERGARIVHARPRGYGRACLEGLAAASSAADTFVFLDGDHSDFVEDLPLLLDPIRHGEADFVLGVRHATEEGSLTPVQRFGNALACRLMEWIHGYRYEDLGPFRVIRRESLRRLAMCDPAFGWTMEMQIKAIRRGLRIRQVPVRYRPRVGTSKISGTFWGSLRAGRAILWSLVKYRR
jgi:glycosyltransferase involved in cell wall biosynthesis